MIGAIKTAHLLGCNPGGEVQGIEVEADTAPFIGDEWRRRILTKEECTAFDEELQRTCTAARERAQEVQE